MALLENPVFLRVLASLLLVLGVFAVRHVLARRIVGADHILDEVDRRQLFYLRSAVTLAILVGLVIIWAGQLQNLVLSLTAVMVAVVIATKELLMCLSGFLLRTTGKLFSVGDWIECNGLLGEVTDHTLLSTVLLEGDPISAGHPYTGRTVMLPNSIFLSHPVRTAVVGRRFAVHRFPITLELPVDPGAGLECAQREAERAFEPYAEEARRVNDELDRRLGVDVAGPEPTVSLHTTDLGKMQFSVALFCPRTAAGELERAITAGFLGAAHAGELGAPAVHDGRQGRGSS